MTRRKLAGIIAAIVLVAFVILFIAANDSYYMTHTHLQCFGKLGNFGCKVVKYQPITIKIMG